MNSPTMTTFEIGQTIIGIILIIATLLIAYVVHRQASALKKVEIQSRAIEGYNVLNRIALHSDENLIAFDRLGRENIDEPIELRRKRWSAFVWLETLQLTFFGLQQKMIGSDYAKQALDQQLVLILTDKDVFGWVSTRGFDPDFVRYCIKIKEGIPTTLKGIVQDAKKVSQNEQNIESSTTKN